MTAFILSWLGIGMDYLISAALILGGGFLAFYVAVAFPIPIVAPIVKWAGNVLMVIGVAFGCFSYGKSTGAADCYSAWHQADIDAQAARQKQETNADDTAAKTSTDQAQTLANQYNEYQKQITQYQSTISPADNCRLPTVDDDRRLCDLIGDNAAGCKNSK